MFLNLTSDDAERRSPHEHHDPRPADPHGVAPDPSVTAVPFSRLLRVELRKLVDTRAGFWLLAAIGIITVAVVVVFLFAAEPDQLTYINFVGATATPQSLLLPVLGILAVTAEWSQRTGLVTFTLEPSRGPHRGRQAGWPWSWSGCWPWWSRSASPPWATSLAWCSWTAPAPGTSGAANVRDFFLLQLIGVVQGFAFGMLLMNTAAAIVLYYVLPIAWNVLFTMVGALEGVAPWLDFNTAIAPAYRAGDASAATTGRTSPSSGTIWVLVPFALGLVRLLRREVKSS